MKNYKGLSKERNTCESKTLELGLASGRIQVSKQDTLVRRSREENTIQSISREGTHYGPSDTGRCHKLCG